MDLTSLLETGTANPVFIFAMAILIGGLHGLEPGHSKTMIASYIIAINGSVSKAVMLGVSAAISHSLIVWVLAAIALIYGNELIGEELEPWFMIVSGVLVIGLALWMVWTSLPRKLKHHHTHSHAQHHHHDLHGGHVHHHDDHSHSHNHEHGHDHGLGHGAALAHAHASVHTHTHEAHVHDHHHHDYSEDAHARAHAAEIRERLASGKVNNWQTIMFGLTGGLIPCPAAITVFILCVHLGQFWLGVTLVGAFSLGLAIILVAVGVVAALGMSAISARTSKLNNVIAAAPYVSGVLIAVVGIYIIWNGYSHLHVHNH